MLSLAVQKPEIQCGAASGVIAAFWMMVWSGSTLAAVVFGAFAGIMFGLMFKSQEAEAQS
jgi:hypothetical protein